MPIKLAFSFLFAFILNILYIYLIQGDHKASVHLIITVQKHAKTV
jgi:uncharacterized protein (UPF0333 family)